MMFSYFPYAAAFTGDEIDPGLVAVSLVLSPFVFIVVAFVSRHPQRPRQVLRAMGLLIPIGLAIGLVSPALGATAGFAVGGVLCLKPLPHAETYRWRAISVAVTVFYTFALLLLITPAGVFAGGILPFLMIGFADEYTQWRADVRRRNAAERA